MKNKKLIKIAAINSLGVMVYVFLVSLFMSNASKIFGPEDKQPLSPMLFLLIFVFSALVVGGLILSRPVMLYIDGFKKEAVKLLFYFGISLLIIIILTGLKLALLK